MRKKMQWWLVSLVASGTLGLKSPVRAGHGPVRREFVSGFGRALGSFGALLSGASSAAGYAETSQVAPGFTSAKDEFPLRTYVDPLFDLTFPKDFFAIRRTIDGDIVRRGGVIFTAGQLKTAEIVTVELFAVKELLAQAEALPYFPEGRIKKWSDLGNDKALGLSLIHI